MEAQLKILFPLLEQYGIIIIEFLKGIKSNLVEIRDSILIKLLFVVQVLVQILMLFLTDVVFHNY